MAITISDTTPRVQYTATSGQTSFTVNFEFFVNADLKVYNASSLLTYAAAPANATQYSVTGAGITGGGSITLGSPGATLNDVITIYRDMSVSRSTDFPTSGTFQVDSLNEELDKLTAMVQQVETDTKYSPKFSQTTATGFNLTFPELVANKVISVNSAGTALEAAQSIVDVQTVAGIASDITTVSNIAANVTSVAGNAANINAVAADATDIGAVAAKATEIGLLGTADAVADMALLGTSDVVTDMALLGNADVIADMALLANADVISDLNTLATSDIVDDLNTLATSDIVSDLNTLATSDIVSDINTLATSDIVSDLNTLATSDIVSDINTLATSDIVSDLNTLATADFVSDLNTIATGTNVTNIGTVATSINDVNTFATRYRISTNNPTTSLDQGDLAFITSESAFKYYTGSAWVALTADTDVKVLVSANDTTAGYLNGKLVAGTNVTLTENNDAGNETLTIDGTGASNGFAIAMSVAL